MSSNSDVQTPFFRWAENGTHIFLTIEVTDCGHTGVDFTNETVIFHGVGKDNKKYELNLKLKKTIDANKSSYVAHGREVEVAIVKSEDSKGWWNSLLADKNAYKNRIKIDWDKWVDEDEYNESKVPQGFGGMGGGFDMSQFGDAGGMDFSKMMGQMGDDDEEADSDDEPLPELESNPPSKDAKDESALESDSTKVHKTEEQAASTADQVVAAQ